MRGLYKFLAVSTLSVGMTTPVVAVDVEEQREEVRQQQEDVQKEQQDVREEQRDVLKGQRDEQQDVTEERKDVMEERQDVPEARRDLRQDVAQTHRAKIVIGMNVKNSQGEALGKIHDLVLNFDDGDIAYVVISSGGLLGMGDTLHAVPWKALSLNSQADGFILNVDQTAWKNAPSFKENDWPEVADREWNKQLESYYR
ncbi:MAG: PRC-barrel domain-containing protein [Pseudomonadota bacterium]|nr:PRC-barrel domain-containing protein [Pseudomonadota bacterium]